MIYSYSKKTQTHPFFRNKYLKRSNSTREVRPPFSPPVPTYQSISQRCRPEAWRCWNVAWIHVTPFTVGTFPLRVQQCLSSDCRQKVKGFGYISTILHTTFPSSLFLIQDSNNFEDVNGCIMTLQDLDSNCAQLCPEEQAATDCFIPLCQILACSSSLVEMFTGSFGSSYHLCFVVDFSNVLLYSLALNETVCTYLHSIYRLVAAWFLQ